MFVVSVWLSVDLSVTFSCKLTLGADPPDLPVTATPLQLPAGAGPGHSHCHGCWGQSVHKGRLTSPWIRNREAENSCSLAHVRVAKCVVILRDTFSIYLGSWLCQIHWSHVGWWNNSSGDSWTGAGTELDSNVQSSEIGSSHVKFIRPNTQ